MQLRCTNYIYKTPSELCVVHDSLTNLTSIQTTVYREDTTVKWKSQQDSKYVPIFTRLKPPQLMHALYVTHLVYYLVIQY